MDSAKWIEVFLIGLGVVATALIGYGQWSLGQQQNSLTLQLSQEAETRNSTSSRQAAEIQLIQLVQPHLEEFADCAPDSASQKMVTVTGEYLSETHESDVLVRMAEKLRDECPEGTLKASINTRIVEATSVLSKGDEKNDWFAVIGTYGISKRSEAIKASRILQAKVVGAGLSENVEVYLTKISNSFAIVLGGPMSESEAVRLARLSRENGIAKDAFPQIDRDWTKLEQ